MSSKRGTISLAEHTPTLIEEWDFKKNGNCSPQSVSYGCKTLVWWKCKECGYEWQARVLSRVHGAGCPVCKGTMAIPGINDLESKHPEILEEWDYSKNTIKPSEIKSGSNAKVWWICKKCGYSWKATPGNRICNGTGCPSCAGYRLIKGKNDLVSLKSPLLDEWDYEKNEISPDNVSPSSHTIVWWKCNACGYSWSQRVCQKDRYSTPCPSCNGRFIKGRNDLVSRYPSLAKEWDQVKNGSLDPNCISPNTNMSVWWICPDCGMSYKAIVESRVSGQGCPNCQKWMNTSLEEQIMFYYVRKVFPDAINNYHADYLGRYEIDVFIPSRSIAIEFDGIKWHLKKSRDLEKDKLAIENGISIIRLRDSRREPLNDGSYEIFYSYRQDRYKYLKDPLEKLFNHLSDKYNVNCCIKIDIRNDLQTIIEEFKLEKKKKSIAFTNPELVEEWDHELNGNTIPTQVTAGSQKKIWWKCRKCGNTWAATPKARVLGHTGCPYCDGKKIKAGFNDLATKRPDLIEDWDYERNTLSPTDVAPNSMKVVSWKCNKCGFLWESSPNYRFRRSKCPNCKK